jgi:hypothetical protein
LAALPKENQRQFSLLYNSHKNRHPVQGIIITNGFGTGSNTISVFATASMINHSCLPNAIFTWNKELQHGTFHALRRIERGEEITVTYTDPNDIHAVRQANLEKSFGFVCCCEVCSLDPPDIVESDKRRTRIRLFREAMPLLQYKGISWLRECYEVVQLLKKEFPGCDGIFLAPLYTEAFKICNSKGDRARASVFADMVHRINLMCVGEDHPDTQPASQLTLDPEDHEMHLLGFIQVEVRY